ncbi:MAG TPA: hypothetical protein VKB55_21600 [Nocardioidaceae bacterium]|nr:hypothetical protein [Nocardioidaceae bacterium]
MTPRRRLWAAVGSCAVLLIVAVVYLASGEDREELGRWQRVVVVGVPGLDWSNVDRQQTPELAALAGDAALGSLTARGASAFSCPRDGWVTLGAGNRARYSDPDDDRPENMCAQQYLPDGAIQPELVVQSNEDRNFGAEPGLLGQEVPCVRTYGLDAQLAAFDAPDLHATNAIPDSPAEWSRSWSDCPLALVTGPPINQRQDPALGEVDALVGDVARAVATEPNTLLLVVGVSDRPDGDTAAMHLALAYGDGLPSGLLMSASTGRVPYVQLIDVAPTALAALGRERPSAMAGRPITIGERGVTPDQAMDRLHEAAQASAAHRADTPALVRWWVGLTSAALLIGLLLVRLGRWRSAVRVGAVAVAAFPVATLLANIVPWWRTDHSQLAWAGCLLAAVLAVSVVALAGPWRRPRWGPGIAVAVISVLVLALDVVTGSHLQLNSLFGYNPIVAGRFIGLGNMPFAVYAVSGLIALAAAMQGQSTKTARWLAVVVGGTLVIIDGAPGLGADFGGVLALVPALALLTMIATGIRLSATRVIGALAAGVVIVAAIAIADYQRPSDDQTHLGRFVGQLLDGTAWEVVERKLDASLYLLLHSPVAILAPFLIVALIGLFWPQDGPGRRMLAEATPLELAAGVGAATAALLGTLLNDSGIAVFVAAGCVTVPMLLAGTLRAVPAVEEIGQTESREQV